MSDPQRLLFDEDASDFAKDLVRSWDDMRPDDEGRMKTLAALGVAGVVSTAIAGGTSTAAAAGAGGSIAPKAVVGGVAWLKWVAVGVAVAGAAVGGAIASSRRPIAAANGAQVVASASASPQAPADPRVADSPSEMPTPSAVVAPLVVTPSALPPASAPRAEAPRRAPAASLEEQLAVLDRARAALDEGAAARAQAVVDDYEARYRDGAFVQEAEVLRIQALLAEGNRPAAERASERFFASFPKSPHTARVRSLLAAAR